MSSVKGVWWRHYATQVPGVARGDVTMCQTGKTYTWLQYKVAMNAATTAGLDTSSNSECDALESFVLQFFEDTQPPDDPFVEDEGFIESW